MSERWLRPRESVVEEQIREAVERGEFDNLPGRGKPLPGLHGPDDDLWWVKGLIRREGLSTDALLPTPLLLRKQIERLPLTVRELATEDAVRAAVSELNRQIVAYIRAPSGPTVPLRRVDVEQTVRQWRAERATARPGRSPADAVPRDAVLGGTIDAVSGGTVDAVPGDTPVGGRRRCLTGSLAAGWHRWRARHRAARH